MKQVRWHTFRGQRYRVVTDEEILGYADVPGREPKTIYISNRLKGLRALETVIHEAMHAEDPDVPERVVERRCVSLARFLWRLGYRNMNSAERY